MIGFWLLAALATTAIAVTYWDKIKEWLNTIVADKIEKVFGYGARKRVHHAVTIVDKIASGIRERVFVYVKKATGQGFGTYEEKQVKVFSDMDEDVVREVTENGPVIQEFTYTE